MQPVLLAAQERRPEAAVHHQEEAAADFLLLLCLPRPADLQAGLNLLKAEAADQAEVIRALVIRTADLELMQYENRISALICVIYKDVSR